VISHIHWVKKHYRLTIVLHPTEVFLWLSPRNQLLPIMALHTVSGFQILIWELTF